MKINKIDIKNNIGVFDDTSDMYTDIYLTRKNKEITTISYNDNNFYLNIGEDGRINKIEVILIKNKFIKKYIEIAKKKKIPYKMIDSLVCSGDIALVVVAKDAVVHEAGDEIVVTSKLEMCHLKHLPDIYYEAMESPICDFHLNIIKEEMPEYAKNYKELTFMDKLFGSKCPICQKLGGKKRG